MTTSKLQLLSATLFFAALTGCASESSLEGNWTVDLESTIHGAKSDGIPDTATPKIREVLDGGRLEITGDSLIMRVEGISDSIARNYKKLGKTVSVMSSKSNNHLQSRYCVAKDELVVHDSSTPIAVVYKRQ